MKSDSSDSDSSLSMQPFCRQPSPSTCSTSIITSSTVLPLYWAVSRIDFFVLIKDSWFCSYSPTSCTYISTWENSMSFYVWLSFYYWTSPSSSSSILCSCAISFRRLSPSMIFFLSWPSLIWFFLSVSFYLSWNLTLAWFRWNRACSFSTFASLISILSSS